MPSAGLGGAYVEFINRPVQLTVSASSTTGPAPSRARQWCTSDGCLYEGLLTAESCRKGVCIKYRVWVHSKDRRTWGAKERWRRRRGDEEAGGCIRQQVADALWELSGKYDVGVWYEYVRVGTWLHQFDVFCGVVVNGIRLDQPHCRSAEECVEEMLRDYGREVERLREPAEPALVIKIDPVEEFLRVWPELGGLRRRVG